MKIAATTLNGGLDDTVTPQFGRTVSFTIVEYDNGFRSVEVVENRGAMQSSGAGIAAAQTLVDRGVEVLLTGNVGPKAIGVLKSAGIRIYRADGLKVREAVEKFINGDLEEISTPTGMGMGGGRGMGRGMGRGAGGGTGRGMGGGRWR